MKILTLNTHSLAEEDALRKMEIFAETVEKEQPEIMAFQEVNQTMTEERKADSSVCGYQPVQGYENRLRCDNYGAALAEKLKENGSFYYWTWVPVKVGYDRYDEGLALFSKSPILSAFVFNISASDDYHNWKTRKALGIRTEKGCFFTVHMGWWKDEEEPFKAQWETSLKEVKAHQKETGESLWVMGDFNSPASVRGEGYDLVRQSGFYDTWQLAEKKDDGYTAPAKIDGWKEAEGEISKQGMRIDYVWHWGDIDIEESRVLFNGKKEPVVSDHYAVMISVKDQENKSRERGV